MFDLFGMGSSQPSQYFAGAIVRGIIADKDIDFRVSSCPSTLCRHCPMNSRWLQVAIQTVTVGLLMHPSSLERIRRFI